MQTHINNVEIVPISYECIEEGFLIKQTVKHHIWRLNIGQNLHQIDLKDQILKRRKIIIVDNSEISNERCLLGGNYEHRFYIENIRFKLMKIDDTYDLMFNSILFSHMYNGAKMREKHGYNMEDMKNYNTSNNTNQIPQSNYDKGNTTFANSQSQQSDPKIGNNLNTNSFNNNYSNPSFDPNVHRNNQDLEKYNTIQQKPIQNLQNHNMGAKRKIFEDNSNNFPQNNMKHPSSLELEFSTYSSN